MSDLSIFAQLQAISTLSEENTIESSRKQLNGIVEFFKGRETYLEEVTIMAENVRNLEVQTLLNCDSFMVQDDFPLNTLPEEFQHDSLGFCKGVDCVFRGRYVYPVKDVRGDVMGFCGYDKFSEIKYLDSHNYGYRAKTYSLWGMEKLPEYYECDDTVFFVEGIVCALYIRQCGLRSLAMLGSSVSPYVAEIIKRFGNRAVVVCDSDGAGTQCRRNLRRKCPLARTVQSHIAKDVDDSRKVDSAFIEELRRLRNPYYQSRMFS